MDLTEDPFVLSTVVSTVNTFLAHSAGLLQFLQIKVDLADLRGQNCVCLVILLTDKLPHQYEVLASEKTVTFCALNNYIV